MKRNLLLMGLAFAVTLAVVFGTRVSADALAVVIGVILGIGASVPTTLLVVFMLTRSRPGQERGQPPAGQSPPVIIVNPPERTPLPAAAPSTYWPYPADPPSRKWTVIGDVETDSSGEL